MNDLHLLDTDCFTLFQTREPTVVSRASAVARLVISIITVEEALTGWYSRVRAPRTPEKLAIAYRGFHLTMSAIGVMEVLPYSPAAIQRQIQLRQQLRRLGKMDLAIAAIALEFNAVLVTRNRSDFEQVPGLRLEDWTQSTK